MKPNLTKGCALLLTGALFGVVFGGGLKAAQDYRTTTGYAFWSKADGNIKFAYLIGYADAELMYRLVLD